MDCCGHGVYLDIVCLLSHSRHVTDSVYVLAFTVYGNRVFPSMSSRVCSLTSLNVVRIHAETRNADQLHLEDIIALADVHVDVVKERDESDAR